MFIYHETYNDTQQRILDAAVQCVKQWGIEKTNLNDIAKQAGVTRATVYSYFPGKDEIIHKALLQAGYQFGSRLHEHINRFKKTRERFLEAVVFAIEELPKEPYLTVITQSDLSAYINADALSDEEGLGICLALFKEIFKNDSIKEAELIEITEFTTRVTLSLLLISGPVKRSHKELLKFLERRLLPTVGLQSG